MTKKELQRHSFIDIKSLQVQERQTADTQTTVPTPSSEGVSVEAYESLQKKNITLKQKLAQVCSIHYVPEQQQKNQDFG